MQTQYMHLYIIPSPKLQENFNIIKKLFNSLKYFKIIDWWLKSPNIWTEKFSRKESEKS